MVMMVLLGMRFGKEDLLMKKANLLLSILLGLILFSGLAFAYQGDIVENIDNATVRQKSQMIQLDMVGVAIPPTSSISFNYYWIGAYDGMDFYMSAVSTGNISTANIVWELMDGTDITTSTLTSGTPLTQLKSAFATIQIFNYKTVTANVTGNFLIWDN
jgi:hypothetical protein